MEQARIESLTPIQRLSNGSKLVKLLAQNWEEWGPYVTWSQMVSVLLDENNFLLEIESGEAYVLLQVRKHPEGTYLAVIWSAGSEIVRYADDIVDFVVGIGKSLKCDWVEMEGRKAWERILERQGFTLASTRMAKRLK